MRKSRITPAINIEFNLCILLAIAFLFLPVELLLSWLCAIIIHELGHWWALRIMKIPVISLSLSARGIQMNTGYMLPIEELFCSAAGPVSSIALLLVVRWLPLIALCGIIQGIFNLLPVSQLDGGRMCRALFKIVMPGRGEYIAHCISLIVVIFIALIVGLLLLNSSPGAVAIVIILLTLKIPCKERPEKVQ